MSFSLASMLTYRLTALAELLEMRELPQRQKAVALSDPRQPIVAMSATLQQPGTGTGESLVTHVVFWGHRGL